MEVYDSNVGNIFLRDVNIFIIYLHPLKYIIKFSRSY